MICFILLHKHKHQHQLIQQRLMLYLYSNLLLIYCILFLFVFVVGQSSDKARPSPNLLGTPRTYEETRRHSWTANSIDKIIKTWKETAKSIENLSSEPTNNNKKSSQLPKPKSSKSSSHMAFL